MLKRALQYVQLALMNMKKARQEIINMQEEYKNSNKCRCYCQRRGDSTSHKGRIFAQYQKQSPVD